MRRNRAIRNGWAPARRTGHGGNDALPATDTDIFFARDSAVLTPPVPPGPVPPEKPDEREPPGLIQPPSPPFPPIPPIPPIPIPHWPHHDPDPDDKDPEQDEPDEPLRLIHTTVATSPSNRARKTKNRAASHPS